MIEHLTVKSFKEKVFDYANNQEWKFEGSKPAIIDFYADWCQPCKMVSPILEKILDECNEKIDVYKIDTENENELASVFGIRNIPSMLFIPKSDKPQMAVGALPEQQIRMIIKDVLFISGCENGEEGKE